MIALLQRVSKASCTINQKLKSKIGKGLLLLLGIEEQDGNEDIEWLVKKIINMRIFSDDEGKMNLSCLDIQGEILVISQFTLHASIKKGNRPSFINAAKPDVAIPFYNQFLKHIESELGSVKSGEFGADMKIELINDGPVTIILNSKDKK